MAWNLFRLVRPGSRRVGSLILDRQPYRAALLHGPALRRFGLDRLASLLPHAGWGFFGDDRRQHRDLGRERQRVVEMGDAIDYQGDDDGIDIDSLAEVLSAMLTDAAERISGIQGCRFTYAGGGSFFAGSGSSSGGGQGGGPPPPPPSPRPVPLRNADRAIIADVKLTGYALNPQHPIGRDKARVFKAALGFDADNAGLLMDAIRLLLPAFPAMPGKVDGYGERYTVDLPITGPAGSATVRTAWIFKPGSDIPELTTLYVKGR